VYNNPLKAVTPLDIEESIQPGERLAVTSMVDMINHELIRQRFLGPETFRLPLAGQLTEGARKAIVKVFIRDWINPRITSEDGMWYFSMEHPNTRGME
jgi:hypothetical protein